MLVFFFVIKLYLVSFFIIFRKEKDNWTFWTLEWSEHQSKSIDHHPIMRSGDYYFVFCQQSSLTLCYLQI